MKNQVENQKTAAAAPATPQNEKLPYEPPRAVFVPLKLEERLTACEKDIMEISCANLMMS